MTASGVPTHALIEVEFEAVADGTNDELVERLKGERVVRMPCVPRVGDLVTFGADHPVASVKVVFWDVLGGSALVRVR